MHSQYKYKGDKWPQLDSNPQHLVDKGTLNHLATLAKGLSCAVSTYLYGAFDCVFLSCNARVLEWIYWSIIWPVWLNGWVFVYELSGCGFESSCCHLNFRFRACFEQGVPWHLDNYSVWIHSETRTWHDKNTQTTEIVVICCFMSVLVDLTKTKSTVI